MQCELCGAKARGPLKTVRIEGAELDVCGECAKYGTEVQQPKRPMTPKRPGQPPVRTAVRKTRDVFDFIEGEIVDDYGERIRNARIARGWSQKDLALEMMERELLIKKIEKGELIPEDDVRRKIEKTLGITLIEGAGGQEERQKPGAVTPTLGDVISIKKVKK
ncbi:MAG: multiprotein bridging factor aMBF1 [Methanoregulaceae archaeon]|nr:multiprotein bridging factor aMBF1 [Methanoregulaceae archaeon]